MPTTSWPVMVTVPSVPTAKSLAALVPSANALPSSGVTVNTAPSRAAPSEADTFARTSEVGWSARVRTAAALSVEALNDQAEPLGTRALTVPLASRLTVSNSVQGLKPAGAAVSVTT